MKRSIPAVSASLAGALTATLALFALGVGHAAPVALRSSLQPKRTTTSGVTTLAWSTPFRVDGGYGASFALRKLPPGDYLASVNVWLSGPSQAKVGCGLYGAKRTNPLMSAMAVDGLDSGRYVVDQTRLVTVTKSVGRVYVACYGAVQETYETDPGFPLQITFTRIDHLSHRHLSRLSAKTVGPTGLRSSVLNTVGGR